MIKDRLPGIVQATEEPGPKPPTPFPDPAPPFPEPGPPLPHPPPQPPQPVPPVPQIRTEEKAQFRRLAVRYRIGENRLIAMEVIIRKSKDDLEQMAACLHGTSSYGSWVARNTFFTLAMLDVYPWSVS